MRLSPDAQKCVVFFGIPSPPNGDIAYGGTGFLVGMKKGADLISCLVTARHVAENLTDHPDAIVRINKKNGGAESIALDGLRWNYHQDSTVDLAAAPCIFDANSFDCISYDLRQAISLKNAGAVMCGDLINIVGLFRLHAGDKKNIPMVHTGHVAALPDSVERISIKDRTTGKIIGIDAMLVEAQTLNGLSGSPVFGHAVAELPFTPRVHAYSSVLLMGMYVGSWDGAPGEILERDRSFGGEIRVPVGMGIVIPADKIIELVSTLASVTVK